MYIFSLMLQYGFLQSTFSLPYGGYCVKPQNISSIILNSDSANASMFCVIGKYSTVINWLDHSSSMVAKQCTTQDTFTHDLAVEVYTRASPLMRFV
ncbi:hypothetical protein BX661DRAFT_68558 [Kickxella alabastrina]|uniref:uncharacterized protein n=1 Tax=Kickxella alabastrina TaxID=61397 RepID=UPI00221F07A4|nr:uncharacterized protein BX661DRAFT_68558 [Kickxella alabastrina]KAI7821308.1 hypothetical protein BX661DRAFT_68558 [Kickxella alabastrina]